MVLYQRAQILTELFHREIYTRTIFSKYGKTDSNFSEIEAGQKQENVRVVQIIRFVRAMDCTIGRITRIMCWYATTKKYKKQWNAKNKYCSIHVNISKTYNMLWKGKSQ